MDKQTLINLIPPTITLIVTSLFGLFVGILVERFKNRFRTLNYEIKTQKVTPPLSNNLGGQLRITLNERVVTTLKVATIELENKNSIDLENLSIRFTLGLGAIFQGNEGFIVSSFSPLLWTQQFSNSFNDVLSHYSELPDDPDNENLKIIPREFQPSIDFVTSNRDYFIPVLNRGDKAIFNFLIEDPIDGTNAGIYPTIVHKSVTLVEKTNEVKQRQRDLWISIAIGFIYVCIVVGFIIKSNQESTALIVWSALIGLSYSIVGYFILIGFKKIRKFFR
ncbi:hypothetical protein [Maribellus sp. YY47]|uniref:hypothetical protein n=1 Tax=Maribellus sp. YY47 TaxID=2929486 RepID=UPI002000C685|nr:hypothetical protein [Maribellus sp. YY47]MCK3684227.1 hypothetical protein [Maribellus sp. YY47]